MPYLFLILLSGIRVLMLVIGTLFAYILGETVYRAINGFLYQYNSPCIEVVSFLIAVVTPLALFYGIYIRKYFWERASHYNSIVFFIAFFGGFIFSLLPINFVFIMNNMVIACPREYGIMDAIAQSASTGLVVAVLTFIGMDLGVMLKHTSHKITHHHHHTVSAARKTSSTKKVKKSKRK